MQMQERITLTPRILELNSDSNDIFMTMNIVILSNDVNYNDAQFSDDFIEGVINNKDTYIGIPFLASRAKLESGLYDNLTHEFDGKTLNTDSIGSFVDFWSETVDDALCLMGQIKVYKRYENTCNAIIELYEEGLLETSCEVLVSEFESIEDGVRTIHYNDGNNLLIGSAIVTNGAEKRSKATLLVSEAYKKDLLEGGEDLSKQKTEVFNKGIKIRHHGDFETFAIKLHEVENQIYNILNPINPQKNHRTYNYYILDIYTEYVIVEDWNDYDTLYKISYKIENDTVVLDSQDNWVSGYKGFIPDGVSIDDLLAEKERLSAELASIDNKYKEEFELMEKELKEQLAELQTEIDSVKETNENLNTKIEELNGVIVSQKEELELKETKVKELNSQVEELSQFKEEVELAQKEALKKELSEKYAKHLSKETFESEEVKQAIESCDVNALNAFVVAEIAKSAKSSDQDGDIVTFASKQEDLAPVSDKDYLLSEIDSK